jgi:hypothetical protein
MSSAMSSAMVFDWRMMSINSRIRAGYMDILIPSILHTVVFSSPSLRPPHRSSTRNSKSILNVLLATPGYASGQDVAGSWYVRRRSPLGLLWVAVRKPWGAAIVVGSQRLRPFGQRCFGPREPRSGMLHVRIGQRETTGRRPVSNPLGMGTWGTAATCEG